MKTNGTTSDSQIAAEYHNETFLIEKDGTVIKTVLFQDGGKKITSGNWFWEDGKKNKVGITFNIDGDYTSYHIRQLKNEELVLETKEQSSDKNDLETNTFESEILNFYEKQ